MTTSPEDVSIEARMLSVVEITWQPLERDCDTYRIGLLSPSENLVTHTCSPVHSAFSLILN